MLEAVRSQLWGMMWVVDGMDRTGYEMNFIRDDILRAAERWKALAGTQGVRVVLQGLG